MAHQLVVICSFRRMLLKLGEYVFYTNVGRDMAHVMSALAYAGNVDGTGWSF